MRRLLPFFSALVLLLAAAGSVLAWSNPNLEAECAPDANHFAWSMTLPTESNYNMEFSWEADFSPLLSSPPAGPFHSGLNEFLTDRGGTTLFVRFASDHNAKDSAVANADLCEQEETPTPTPEGSQGQQTGSPSPEGSQLGGTGTPVASLPNSAASELDAGNPLATIGFGLTLIASLAGLAAANVRGVRVRR